MKRSRLNAKERATLRELGNESLQLRADWQRRLENALLCLSLSDPKWIMWVEREIDMESMPLIQITRLVEIRSRACVLKAYSYFGRKHISDLIFRDSWTFTDRGNLGPG